LAKPHSSSSKVVEDLALGLQQQHQALLGRLLKPRQQLLAVVLVALGPRQQQVELPVAVFCLVKQQQQLVEVVGVGLVGLEQQQQVQQLVGQVALGLEVVLLGVRLGRRYYLVHSWTGKEGVQGMIGCQVALQQHQQQRRQCRLGRLHQQQHRQHQMEQQQRLLQVRVVAIAAAARVV
jgi:hypothetical protein